MSASDEIAAGNDQLIGAGLASVLNALGLHRAPLFSLAPRPTILMVTVILAAIAGKSFRVDLPTLSRIRINSHLILSGTERIREVKGKRQSLPRGVFLRAALLYDKWCTALQGPQSDCNFSPWAHIATKKVAIVVFSDGRAVRDWRRGRVIDAEVTEK